MDKIICVGKNYLEHAKELGDVVPEKPVIFLKPPSVLNQAPRWNSTLIAQFPEDDSVQPECELALRIGKDAYQLKTFDDALISHISVGLDMTKRARQSQLKKDSHPWTTAKVFKDAAILGPWLPAQDFTNFEDLEFKLLINGQEKQHGKASQMMMPCLELLVYISAFFPLKKGDVIYTGTPAGVTTIHATDVLQVRFDKYQYDVKFLKY